MLQQLLERQDLSSEERVACMEAMGAAVHAVGSGLGRDGRFRSTKDIETRRREPGVCRVIPESHGRGS